MPRVRTTAAIVLSFLLIGTAGARAATLQPIGPVFDQPIYVTSDPGNPNRLFVVEREGKIELIQNGAVSQFADLSSKVECFGGCEEERGLMSIALAPDFDSSGRLYVDYANNEDGTIHVDELTAEPDRKSAPPSSLRPLLSIPHSDAPNHNGGQLQFGPDGDLYISTGDGGGSNDQFENAQNLERELGKILRIHPDPEGPAPFYTVPSDNPFDGVGTDYAPIWSYGLRNPFRFSFDRLTGDMVIGDVGQEKSEEIDYAPAPALGRGANYGWNCREGLLAGPLPSDPECATPPAEGFVGPVFEYPHTPDPDLGGENRCAIIGGYVVRDQSLGSLYGRYLYGDHCNGGIRSLSLSHPSGSDRSVELRVDELDSFGEDSCGRLYAVSGEGEVYRIEGETPAICPSPQQQPPTTEPPHRPTPFVGIKPQRRRVERGKVALLTVWVSPCDKRKGQPVKLLRDGHANGSRFLSRACTARFLPRVRRTTTFTAAVPEDGEYLSAESRHLKIRIAPRRHERR